MAEKRGSLEIVYPGDEFKFMSLLETFQDLAKFHPGLKLFETARPEREPFPVEEGIVGVEGNLTHPEAPPDFVEKLKRKTYFWGYDPIGFVAVIFIDKEADVILELFREVEEGIPVGRAFMSGARSGGKNMGKKGASLGLHELAERQKAYSRARIEFDRGMKDMAKYPRHFAFYEFGYVNAVLDMAKDHDAEDLVKPLQEMVNAMHEHYPQ